MGLFSELKRRNVFKVGIAYLALGWVMVQITDVAVPALNLSPALNGIVFYLGLIGFPFAIFFAWAFELTPDGMMRTEDVDREQSIRQTTGQKINYIIIGLMAIAITFLLYDRGAEPEEIILVDVANTIAVMPFADMSPDGTQEYFGDGIAEEILNVLVSVDGLDVTSRTSSFAFKDQNLLTPAIAEQLGVNYILEGSIRSAGNRVRVTAQLIDVTADSHMWSETFDRDLTDIFAIQDEISKSIASALRIELIGDETLKEASTTNMEAYSLYLQGHKLFLERGSGEVTNIDNLERATILLEQATSLDPDFADAWADIAGSYLLLPSFAVQEYRIEDQLPKAKLAAEKAISLNPDLSQAWAAKGFVHFSQFEFENAEEALIRATELNPKNETAWLWLGVFYEIVGNYDEAIINVEKAILNSPNSKVNYGLLSGIVMAAGKFDRVIELSDYLFDYFNGERLKFQLAILPIVQNDRVAALKVLKELYRDRHPNITYDEADVILEQLLAAYYDPSLREQTKINFEQNLVKGDDFIRLGYQLLQETDFILRFFDDTIINKALVSRMFFSQLGRTMLNDQKIKDTIINLGFLTYWQNHQFPYFCRPIGADDFECQNRQGNYP